MFQRQAAGLAAAAATVALAVLPASAFAGVYKCVAANGASTFSDKPCPTVDGVKQADIGSDSALSNAMVRDRDRSQGQSCSEMAVRVRYCGVPINNTIATHFRESCYGPQHRYEMERDKLANQQRRGQPIDWDHDPRYHQPTGAELKCGVLVTDMWQFLKDNFRKDFTDQEITAVDYQVQATETNQQVQPARNNGSKKTTTVVIIRSQ